MTKVPNTGPKGKAPRGALPMVKKTHDQLCQGCQTGQFVVKKFFFGKIGHFQRVWPPKIEIGHFEKIGYFGNMASLDHFSYFCPD